MTAYAPSTWVVVETDAAGDNGYVYATALVQCFKLNLGESPFWGNFGIPAKASVQQQIAPDYAVAKTQSFFAQFFASLIIAKAPYNPSAPLPTYNVNVIFKNGRSGIMAVAL